MRVDDNGELVGSTNKSGARMDTLVKLLPIVWILAALSPFLAIAPSALLYERARPKQRITGCAYVLIQLLCAVIGYYFGVALPCIVSTSSLISVTGSYISHSQLSVPLKTLLCL